MSVAAALSLTRAQLPHPTSRPSQPRSDAAAIALNGIESLSAIDPTLSTLAAPLLLLTPQKDRLTLSPSEADALSVAVVTLIERLAPVFSLRHAQKVIRWVIEYLHVGTVGREEEIDALFVAILPFHGCPWFVEVVKEGLKRKWGAWNWLQPVGKKGIFVGLDFIRERCPMEAVWKIIEQGVNAVKHGINCSMLARFLGAVATWKIAKLEARDRAYAALKLLKAIEDIVVVKRRGHEVICALVICLAVLIERGLDHDVILAAAKVIGFLAVKNKKSEVRDTALACLELFVVHGLKVMPRGPAQGILKLSRVEGKLYLACVMGVMDGKPSAKMIEGVGRALAGLESGAVTGVIVKLLTALTVDKNNEWKAEGVHEALVRLLSRLVRGRYAENVDAALKHNFATRKKKCPDTYNFLDSVLADALSGTSFEVLKENIGTKPTMGTVFGMMAHPVAEVRLAALERISASEDIQKEGNHNGILTSRCLEMVKDDPDLSVASHAANCLSSLANDERRSECFESIVGRFLVEQKSLLGETGNELPPSLALDQLAQQVILACTHYATEDAIKVKALLIGLLLGDDFSTIVSRIEKIDDVKSLLSIATPGMEIPDVGLEGDGKLCSLLTTSLETQLSTKGVDCVSLVRALGSWNGRWAAKLLRLWLVYLSQNNINPDPSLGRPIIEAVYYIAEHGSCDQADVCKIIELAVVTICNISKAGDISIVDNIWSLAAENGDGEFIGTVLKKMIHRIGLDNTIELLNRFVKESSEKKNLSRRRTLKWFIGLCEKTSSPVVQQKAISTALYALYGNDVALRDEMIAISKTNIIYSAKKQKLMRFLRLCMSEISKLDTTESRPRSIDATGLRDALVASTLSALQQKHGYPSFLMASELASSSGSNIFRCILQKICEESSPYERLFLLRAVERVEKITVTEAENLLKLLQKIPDADMPEEVRAETLLRVSDLLFPNGHLELKKEVVQDSVQYFATKLEILESAKTSGQEPAPSLQHAVVLSTGQLFHLCAAFNKSTERELSVRMTAHQLLFGLLLAVSVRSSAAGRCARQVLDSICEDYVKYLVPFVLRFVDGHTPKVKRQRVNRASSSDDLARVPIIAGLGAIETLRRLLSNDSTEMFGKWRVNLHEIMSMLWNFMAGAMAKCGGNVKFLDEDAEYQLQIVISVLTSLHSEEDKIENNTEGFNGCNLNALKWAILYAGLAEHENQTAIRLAIRKASLKLGEVLASSYGEEVCVKLSKAVQNRVAHKDCISIRFLYSLAPVLLKSGCDFRKVCRWLSQAAFHAGVKSGTSAEDRHLIASCCQLVDDKEVASTVCLQEFSRCGLKILSRALVAQECCHVLLSIESNAVSDMNSISVVDDKVRCELSSLCFLHPQFQSKLAHAVKNQDGDGHDHTLVDSFSNLYQALLRSSSTHEHDSITRILGVLPLPELSVCVVESLTEDENDDAFLQRALAALLARLRVADAGLSYVWNIEDGDVKIDNSEQVRAEGMFLSGVGDVLCQVVESQIAKESNLNGEEMECTRLALECLDVLSVRVGKSSVESVVRTSNAPISVINSRWGTEIISNPGENEELSKVVSTALKCISSMIKMGGEQSVGFMPQTIGVAMEILNGVFTKSKRSASMSLLVEASGMVCKMVLSEMPKLFGRSAIQSIAKLVLSSRSKLCKGILEVAMKKTPSIVSVAALLGLSEKLGEVEVCGQGLGMFIESVGVVVGACSRGEFKVRMESVVRTLLNCVEFSRGGKNEEVLGGEVVKEVVVKGGVASEECEIVDGMFVESMMRIVMKISETEFKDMFKRLVEWVDGGAGGEKKEEGEMMRGIPFLRLSVKMLGVLKGIYVPYFFQMMGEVLRVVSRGKMGKLDDGEGGSAGGGRKRRREEVEKEEEKEMRERVVRMGFEYYEVGLENVTMFLKQDLNEVIFTSEVAGKILESLLCAFDKQENESESLISGFVALAKRVVTVGGKQESREESREMLVGIGRGVLERAKSENVGVRRGSLQICTNMAVAVGDEYLVGLGEWMAVLAEVVDDEDADVRENVREFVSVLEGMGGEGIMDSLRK